MRRPPLPPSAFGYGPSETQTERLEFRDIIYYVRPEAMETLEQYAPDISAGDITSDGVIANIFVCEGYSLPVVRKKSQVPAVPEVFGLEPQTDDAGSLI